MKRVATRRGRNEASVSVHPVLKFRKTSLKEQKWTQSWRKEGQTEKEKRGSWSHLSSVSSNDFPRCVTHVHWFQSPFHYRAVSNQMRRWFLKLFLSLLLALMPSFGCAHSLSRPPKLPRVLQQKLFSFVLHVKDNKIKIIKRTNVDVSFKYIYICIHVSFHSGQKMTFTAICCLCLSFVNVHSNQVSQ